MYEPGLGICRSAAAMANDSRASRIWWKAWVCSSCFLGTQCRQVSSVHFLCIVYFQIDCDKFLIQNSIFLHLIHCCAHISAVFVNHWSHVWNCRPFELIAVASEKAVSIWKLQFPLNSRGRLVVIRAAHLPHHNGEVCLLVALCWFSLFCCENEFDLFTMFTVNYFNWF